MWDARGRLVGFSSMLLLVLLLLASPLHAAGYFASKDSGKAAQDLLLTKDEGKENGTSTPLSDSTTLSTEESTLLTNESTPSTDESTWSTDESIPSTDESIPSTDESSSSTNGGSLTTPTIDDPIQLYEDTRDQLTLIIITLDNFLILVENDNQRAGRTPGGGSRDHPAGWWKLGKDARASGDFSICKNPSAPPTDVCKELQDHLETTEGLVSILNNNVDNWGEKNLSELKKEREGLFDTYTKAKEDESFKGSVNENFTSVITSVKKDVEASRDKVNEKISNLTLDKTGSVVLVAVIGTFGGLMMVGLVGVMVYGAVKKEKIKKKCSSKPKSSSTPYNKLQGETIPIDGFLSNGPEPRQASRMDPYVRNPPPSSRSDPYADPHGPRSESNYRGPTVTRVGQGLPRTHF